MPYCMSKFMVCHLRTLCVPYLTRVALFRYYCTFFRSLINCKHLFSTYFSIFLYPASIFQPTGWVGIPFSLRTFSHHGAICSRSFSSSSSIYSCLIASFHQLLFPRFPSCVNNYVEE